MTLMSSLDSSLQILEVVVIHFDGIEGRHLRERRLLFHEERADLPFARSSQYFSIIDCPSAEFGRHGRIGPCPINVVVGVNPFWKSLMCNNR